MNFNSTLPINGGNIIPTQVPTTNLKSRTRSLVSQSNISTSIDANKDSKKNVLTVMDTIKKLFTSRTGTSTNNNENQNSVDNNSNRNSSCSNLTNVHPNYRRTRLQKNKQKLSYESNFSQHNNSNLVIGNSSNIEWQPVYHDTCKIKLPVEPITTKITMPQEALEEWENEQAKISKAVENFTKLSKGENCLNENEETNVAPKDCFKGMGLSQTPCTNESVNKDEPYSKFKYYYNYYLVDDYLDSLAQSQNKKIDATGLDEHGELYENVSLMVKPILKTKERLESGVPYDPKVVIN